MKTKAMDYLLPTSKNLLSLEKWTNNASDLETFVDGIEIYSAMETSIISAEKYVFISFWAFDPLTKVVSSLAKAKGLTTWLEMLVYAAKKGVRIRIIFTDYDPLFQYSPHFWVWFRYRKLITVFRKEFISTKLFQVIVVMHEAEVPINIMQLANFTGLDKKRADLFNKEKLIIRQKFYINVPGLWPILEITKAFTLQTRVKNATYPGFPASHHQKVIIVDGQHAFVTSINLFDKNADNRDHTLLEKFLPWHDIAVRVKGNIIWNIVSNFLEIWNTERKRTETFLDKVNNIFVCDAVYPSKFKMPSGLTTELSMFNTPIEVKNVKATKIFPAQIHTTKSRNNEINIIADIIEQEIVDGYLKAISHAERYIYIENQYFRSKPIADAIIKRHSQRPKLTIILVLPKKPEELINRIADEISILGARLQYDAIKSLQDKISSRNIGIYYMSRDKKIIYVHSKILLIDDVYCSVGSANINPRSFYMDTELNIAWYHSTRALSLRLNLWGEMLGTRKGVKSWKPSDYVKKWSKIAIKNKRSRGSRASGFIMPYENIEPKQKNKLDIIPEEFAFLNPVDSIEIT